MANKPGASLETAVNDKVVAGRLPQWYGMDTAPRTRPIFITDQDHADVHGMLCYWRTTRVKRQGIKGWHPVSYWASVLTNKQLPFPAYHWRESVSGAALADAKEREAAE